MTRDVHTCSPSDSLNRAAQLMWDQACGTLPVEGTYGIGSVAEKIVRLSPFPVLTTACRPKKQPKRRAPRTSRHRERNKPCDVGGWFAQPSS